MSQEMSHVSRRTLIICLVLSVFFVAGPRAFAEAVYLRNGRVMVGAIVEKTHDYIVLKSGEGPEAVTATIFLEDIAKIEEEEIYVQELSAVPFYLKRTLTPTEASGPAHLPLRPPTESLASRISSLVKGDKVLKAGELPPEDRIRELPDIDASPLTLQAYASYLQMLAERKAQLEAMIEARKRGEPPPSGDGRIAGAVTLAGMPDKVSVSAEASGGLYVYLLKEQRDGRYTFPVPMLYDIVDAANITLALVRYEVAGIPPGRYKVFAQWDVAPPAVREERTKKDAFLNYLGAQGDYSGFYKDAIDVEKDAVVKEIDFDCVDQSPFNEIFFSWLQPFQYEITDIYYTRPRRDDPRILLVAKNLGSKAIDVLALDLYVDDMKMVFPLELHNIAAGQEKEFDISSFFVTHLKLTEGARLVRKARSIRFRIQNPITREVEFEKNLYIY